MHVQHGQDQAKLPTPPPGDSLQPTEAGASAPARNAPQRFVFDSNLDVVLSDFEAACQSDSPPTLQDYWARATMAGVADSVDQRRALLQEMIALDLEYRWKRKTTALPDDQTLLHGGAAEAIPQLEDYQSLLESQFGPMPAWPVSLILDECRIQQRYAELPNASAYQQRFPDVPGLPEALRQFNEKPAAGMPPMPTVSDNSPLADYELVREIARGGMGVVYEARQKSLRRTVAIKMILAGQLASDEAVRRFYAEAQAAAGLSHPHIVPVFEVGQDAGRHFFSMGYVDGQSLSARVAKDGPLAPAEAARLVETISQAVDYAHQQGVVHRDLKPQNVLLTKDGRPLVTDFGLAKQMGELDGLTVSGQLVGTPSFMSPEQAQGRIEEVGPLSDVYALGAVLYHLLTGRPPFHTASMLETLKQVIERDPLSPRSLNPEVNKDLETICLKCLQKDASKRYASAQQLADDLRRFIEGRDILARPISHVEKAWRWCRRRPSTAALITMTAIVLLIGVPGILWYQGQVTAMQALARVHESERTIAEERAAAAQQMADAQEYHATVNAVRQDITRGRPGWTQQSLTRLSHAAGLNTPVRSPIELRTEATRCLLGIDVLPGLKVADGIHAGQVTFSQDGKLLAVGELKVQAMVACRVLVFDAASGEALHKLSFFGLPLFHKGKFVQDGCRELVFSPDGRWLVVGARSGNVHAWDLRQSPPKIQTWRAHGQEMSRPLFLPDSRRLLTGCPLEKTLKAWDLHDGGFKEAGQLVMGGNMNEFSLDPRGEFVVIDHDPGLVTSYTAKTLKLVSQVSKGERGSVVCTPWADIYLAGSGKVLELVTSQGLSRQSTYDDPADPSRSFGYLTHAQFSQDGGLLLVVTRMDGKCTLWDTVSGKVVFNAVFEPGATAAAQISPDGRRLAVAGDRGVQLHEIVVNRGQSLVMERPTAPDAMVWGFPIQAAGRSYERHYGLPRQVALTLDGKVLVAGTQGKMAGVHGMVLRHHADGRLDTGWEHDGVSLFGFQSLGLRFDEVRSLADGSVRAVGPAGGPGRSAFPDGIAWQVGIGHYDSSGFNDNRLAGQGKMILPVDAVSDRAIAAAICADGRVVAAAITQREGREELVLARVLPDGQLDPTFGDSGYARHALTEQPGHRLHDLLVLPDDQIALAMEYGAPPQSWTHMGLFNAQGAPRFAPHDLTDWYPGATETRVETTAALTAAADGSVILAMAGTDESGPFLKIVRRGTNDQSAHLGDGFVLRPAVEELRIHRALVQADGKLVVAGAGTSNGRRHAFAGRVQLQSQDFDLTFDGDGWRLYPVEGCDSEAFGLALSPEGEVLLAGAENDDQHVWRLSAQGQVLQETGKIRPTLVVQEGGSPDAPLVTSFLRDSLLAAHRPTGRVALSQFFPDGRAQDLHIWQQGQSSWKLLARQQMTDLDQVYFSPDGGYLWGISGTQRIWAWEISTGSMSERFENWFEGFVTGRSNLTCLTVGSDFLLVGTQPGDMLRLGMQKGQPQRWKLETGPVRCVALSPNEGLTACGAEDGQVRLLRLPGGESAADLRPHDESVEAVSFSSDGKLLATGSLDRTVRLWRLRDGGAEELLDLKFPAPVLDVQFRPDGRVLAVRVRNEIAIRLLHLDQLREFLAGVKLDWTN